MNLSGTEFLSLNFILNFFLAFNFLSPTAVTADAAGNPLLGPVSLLYPPFDLGDEDKPTFRAGHVIVSMYCGRDASQVDLGSDQLELTVYDMISPPSSAAIFSIPIMIPTLSACSWNTSAETVYLRSGYLKDTDGSYDIFITFFHYRADLIPKNETSFETYYIRTSSNGTLERVRQLLPDTFEGGFPPFFESSGPRDPNVVLPSFLFAFQNTPDFDQILRFDDGSFILIWSTQSPFNSSTVLHVVRYVSFEISVVPSDSPPPGDAPSSDASYQTTERYVSTLTPSSDSSEDLGRSFSISIRQLYIGAHALSYPYLPASLDLRSLRPNTCTSTSRSFDQSETSLITNSNLISCLTSSLLCR